MNEKSLAIILGPGRSGTSMLTNILLALGMSGSSDMIGKSEANPKGAFEDKEIFQLQRDIFNELNLSGYAPLPEGSEDRDEIKKYITSLQEIIHKRLQGSKEVWGFKDPKTASLLPIWSKVLNPFEIVPKHVLAIRNPSAVVLSMNKYYGDDFMTAELAWLIRICDALYYTKGDCFIVHYEAWFTDESELLIQGLVEFLGLKNTTENILSGIVEKTLDRTNADEYEIQNPLVKKLYEELKQCSGDHYNKGALMDVVDECRLLLKSFQPLVPLMTTKKHRNNEMEVKKLKNENKSLLHQLKNEEVSKVELTKEVNAKIELINKVNAKIDSQDEETSNVIANIKSDNLKLIIRENDLLQKNIKLDNENNSLNIKVLSLVKQLDELKLTNENKKNRIDNLEKAVQVKKNRIDTLEKAYQNKKERLVKSQSVNNANLSKIKKLKKNVFIAETSISYKIGQTFVRAVKYPGKATILMPFNFLKVIFEAIFVRKYIK